MKLKLGLVSTGLLSMLAVSCGNNPTSDKAVDAKFTNPLSRTTAEVNEELNQFENLAADTQGLKPNIYQLLATDWWTDADTYGFQDPREDDLPKISASEYLPFLLKSSAVNSNDASINVFGRIKTAMTSLCALSQAIAPDAMGGNTLKAGTYKAVFTSDLKDTLKKNCDTELPSSFDTATMTIAPSDLANFEFKFDLCEGSHTKCDESVGSHFATQYMTTNNSMIKIGVNESSVQTEVGQQVPYIYQTIVELNKSSKTFKAEYRSLRDGNNLTRYTFHRLFKVNKEAMVVSLRQNDDLFVEAYALKGELDKSADKPIALSFWNSAAPSIEYQKGCYTRSTNALVEDGVSSCNTTLVDFTDDTTLVDNLMTDLIPGHFVITDKTAFNFNDFASALNAPAANNK